GFAIVCRDDIEIHFWTCKERRIAEHTSAYFRVDDVDALHATLSAANDGGRLSEVADRAWGMREFYVTDPDGNLLKFGVPAPAAADKRRGGSSGPPTSPCRRRPTICASFKSARSPISAAASSPRARASTSAPSRTAPACRPHGMRWGLPTSTARRRRRSMP